MLAAINQLPSQFTRRRDIPAIMFNQRKTAPTTLGSLSFFGIKPIDPKKDPSPSSPPPKKQSNGRSRRNTERLDASEREEIKKYGVTNLDDDDSEEEGEEDSEHESDREYIVSDDDLDESSNYEDSEEDIECTDDDYSSESEASESEDEEEILEKMALEDLQNASYDHDSRDQTACLVSIFNQNTMKKFLTPVTMLYPINQTFGAYTVKNVIVYLLDVAASSFHSYIQSHMDPLKARIHALAEIKKAIPLKTGSHESTIMAYKFHRFVAEMLLHKIIDLNYSVEATDFFTNLTNPELDDRFDLLKVPEGKFMPCYLTPEGADVVIVIHSCINKKPISKLCFNSTTESGEIIYDFIRFWFFPFVIQNYVEYNIAPFMKPLRDAPSISSQRALFNSHCLEMVHTHTKRFVSKVIRIFEEFDFDIGENTMIEFE